MHKSGFSRIFFFARLYRHLELEIAKKIEVCDVKLRWSWSKFFIDYCIYTWETNYIRVWFRFMYLNLNWTEILLRISAPFKTKINVLSSFEYYKTINFVNFWIEKLQILSFFKCHNFSNLWSIKWMVFLNWKRWIISKFLVVLEIF